MYSEYLRPLHDRHVIGTNAAYLLGKWVSAMYFSDKSFWLANSRITKPNGKYFLDDFHNLKVTAADLPRDYRPWQRNIKRMRRDERAGITPERDMLRWNRNAGGGAINLAAHFGVKRILLLGFDMQPDKRGVTHWHAGLPNYQRPTQESSFKKFLMHFPHIARDAKNMGIEILNVSENGSSKLDHFPKVKLKEVL